MGRIELAGKTINDIQIIDVYGSAKSGDILWNAKCTCGVVFQARASSLKSGNTKSCGCRKNELISKANSTHGGVGTSLYNVWKTMTARCTNPNNLKYERYGARGVKITKEWDDFTVFRDWANDNGYKKGLTIDRIDNDGDYKPRNCRWATYKTQSRNRSDNRKIIFNGVEKILSDWSKITGLGHRTIGQRLDKGWSVEKALTKKTGMVDAPTPEELIKLLKYEKEND